MNQELCSNCTNDEIEYLTNEVKLLRQEVQILENLAQDWMLDYYKLKEKYEPETWIKSDSN